MMAARTRCKVGILVNVLALAALLVYLGSLGVPASEATRLRNALLLDIADRTDMIWTPREVPPSFRVETRPPSAEYAGIVRTLGIDGMHSDWAKALALAGHLTQNAKDLGAIQSDLGTAYSAIVDGGRGYCADFTQVYLGLAHAAGLFAREWAFSFDGFGGYGHAFIEVYDRQRGRWIWVDVYNNVHAVDALSREPLSAEQFRAYVLGKRDGVIVQRNGPGRVGYKHDDKLIDYYRRGATEWYLWAGNAVFTYEQNPLVRIGSAVAAPVAQAMAILAGVHPRIVVVPTEDNAAQITRMGQLRNTLGLLALTGLVLFVALVWQLVRLLRLRVQPGPDGCSGASPLVTR